MKSATMVFLAAVFLAAPLRAQDTSETLSYHFQFTGIQQSHTSFSAPYTGRNSLSPNAENLLSITSTIYLGSRLWNGGEIYFDPELAGGSGFSATKGIAGFPNGEIYRVDNPSPKIFLARLFLRQHFALGEETEPLESDQNQVALRVPRERLTVTIGKLSLTDIFDDNRYSHDARTQFLNWALWSGAAWDYAADTRGYTWGIFAELHIPSWLFNFAAVMVPSTANGPSLDHDISRAFSLNLEAVKPYAIGDLEGRVHAIVFLNRAAMGIYRSAINLGLAMHSAPDIDRTNGYNSKYGFVLSAEQSIGGTAGVFSRFSWNDGRTETWAFTEIDMSFHAGLTAGGGSWGRKGDNLGVAYAVNALSGDHRDYLAAGGYGFLIGDGALRYAPEHIVEAFYSSRLFPTLTLTLDDQVVFNPAYNRDRGPVLNVFSIRGHVEM